LQCPEALSGSHGCKRGKRHLGTIGPDEAGIRPYGMVEAESVVGLGGFQHQVRQFGNIHIDHQRRRLTCQRGGGKQRSILWFMAFEKHPGPIPHIGLGDGDGGMVGLRHHRQAHPGVWQRGQAGLRVLHLGAIRPAAAERSCVLGKGEGGLVGREGERRQILLRRQIIAQGDAIVVSTHHHIEQNGGCRCRADFLQMNAGLVEMIAHLGTLAEVIPPPGVAGARLDAQHFRMFAQFQAIAKCQTKPG